MNFREMFPNLSTDQNPFTLSESRSTISPGDEAYHNWEKVNADSRRMRVYEGWIYDIGGSLIFIKEPWPE